MVLSLASGEGFMVRASPCGSTYQRERGHINKKEAKEQVEPTARLPL
jgi:hypothetical protein